GKLNQHLARVQQKGKAVTVVFGVARDVRIGGSGVRLNGIYQDAAGGEGIANAVHLGDVAVGYGAVGGHEEEQDGFLAVPLGGAMDGSLRVAQLKSRNRGTT